MATTEDQRAASALKANLSSTLMTVALAFIGAEAAIATFVLDKREHLGFFYSAFIASMVCLTISGFAGGYGIRSIYRDGFDEGWNKKDGGFFNAQALALLLGIVLVCASAFAGEAKKPDSLADSELKSMREKLSRIEQRLGELEAKPALVACPQAQPCKTKK